MRFRGCSWGRKNGFETENGKGKDKVYLRSRTEWKRERRHHELSLEREVRVEVRDILTVLELKFCLRL